MYSSFLPWLLILLSLPRALGAQSTPDRVPVEKMSLYNRIMAGELLRKHNCTFQTVTRPVHVHLRTMDRLFDHPRLAAAMWRECQFVPRLYAFVLPEGLVVDDPTGLRGTLTLAYREPGLRVYLIDGYVARGRMGNPFAVSARMLVVYRYWEGPEGFQCRLQAWTTLDSAILGVLTRPFKKYVQRRQEEFMVYILGNMTQGGEFAEGHLDDFLGPIQREGDPVAAHQYVRVFKTH